MFKASLDLAKVGSAWSPLAQRKVHLGLVSPIKVNFDIMHNTVGFLNVCIPFSLTGHLEKIKQIVQITIAGNQE